MYSLFTKPSRRLLVGGKQKFEFRHTDISHFDLSSKSYDEISLYIHIPFCKSMCPYCPYNRIPYRPELIPRYFNALDKEIHMYRQMLGDVKINSVYIGGGTPTNAIDELSVVLKKLRNTFDITGEVAIETTVADINRENLSKLEEMQINLLSIGVQSFFDKYLRLLGRNYNSQAIYDAFTLLSDFKFDSINVDLMFAFPNQTKQELLKDLDEVSKLQIDQVTMYPLFTFPYTTIGEYKRLRKLKMPKFNVRREFYKEIYNYFAKRGYEMASVWGFKKKREVKEYSSVTRDFYFGLGAGAGSRFKDVFYFNTFSVDEYEKRLLEENKFPISIDMPISQKLSNVYWIYWRLYETRFSYKGFLDVADKKMRFLLHLFHLLGFYTKVGDEIQLTEKGSFWIHLIQNYFVLNYIDRVWSVMKVEPWPERIAI